MGDSWLFGCGTEWGVFVRWLLPAGGLDLGIGGLQAIHSGTQACFRNIPVMQLGPFLIIRGAPAKYPCKRGRSFFGIRGGRKKSVVPAGILKCLPLANSALKCWARICRPADLKGLTPTAKAFREL
jgi:hypothetical protein